MRTNIDIDDELLTTAMHAGPYSTKKETVEAGLRLLARQAAYREILKWEGKLKWEGDESIDWAKPAEDEAVMPAWPLMVQEPHRPYVVNKVDTSVSRKPAPPKAAATRSGKKQAARHAGG